MRGEHRSITLNRERIEYLRTVSQIECDSCIEWPYGLGVDGRGAIKYRGKKDYAYRVVYMLATGTDIPRGMEVCHTCDNPACINKRHFFLGTHQENFADAKRKRRMRHGDEHPQAKITDANIRRVRELRSQGLTQSAIAQMFGVSRPLISMLTNGKHRSEVNA